MPARSNEFQRLLALIQRTFAPLGAKVEESAMVRATGIGELREIDVLVTSVKDGEYKLKFAFEAKDHKRKLDLTNIEGIIGKYRAKGSIDVDKVFIVTRNGVSNGAKKKAELNGIEILTLREIEQTGIPGFSKKSSKIDLSIQPHPAHVSITSSDGTTISGDTLKNARFVCKCHGHDKGTIQRIINFVMTEAKEQIHEKVNEALENRGLVCVQATRPINGLRVAWNNTVSDVSTLNFHIHASKLSGPIDIAEYELFGDHTTPCRMLVASGDIAGTNVEISHPVKSSGNLIFQIKPSKTAPH